MIKIIEKLPEDRWEEFRELRVEAVTNVPQAFLSNPKETKNKQKEDWIDWSKSSIFAEDNGKLVGTVAGIIEEKEKLKHIAKIVGVYVRPEYRGKKIGEMLLKRMIEKLSSIHGIKKVKLGVVVTQKPAFSLYKKLGFVEVGLEKYAVKVADEYFDEYLMELYL